LGSGNLRDVVRLPSGEDQNEWIAVNSRVFIHIWIDDKINMFTFTLIKDTILIFILLKIWKRIANFKNPKNNFQFPISSTKFPCFMGSSRRIVQMRIVQG
jgi:hypothetical protein